MTKSPKCLICGFMCLCVIHRLILFLNDFIWCLNQYRKFREVWRSNIQERLWYWKGLPWNDLVSLCMFCRVLRVYFLWNSCGRSKNYRQSYLCLKRLGNYLQGPSKGPWGRTQNCCQSSPRQAPDDGAVDRSWSCWRPIEGFSHVGLCHGWIGTPWQTTITTDGGLSLRILHLSF